MEYELPDPDGSNTLPVPDGPWFDAALEYQCDRCGDFYTISEYSEDADMEEAASYRHECVKEG